MFSTFGNKVMIKNSPQTVEKGLAGKIGVIFGETTPSMINFEIIGTPKEDYAISVHFDDLGESFWFDAELLEQIDAGEGTVMTLDGIPKKWTKGKKGEWIEEDTDITQVQIKSTSNNSAASKKWWKFWA